MFDAAVSLDVVDPELSGALRGERERQETFVELIASENYVSRNVLAAQGSELTNKYADGYPGRRTYSGCEFADAVERLAIERVKELFGAAYANVQPYSGSQANEAVYAALLEPGDTLLGMSAEHGGHITHGAAASFSGRLFDAVQYGVDPATGLIDYEQAAQLARAHRPKLIVAGFSAYAGAVDWARFRAMADAVGAYLLVDMAHVAGLVAAGLHPNPVPIADVTTSTTHKTLRGPRGGMILARGDGDLARRLDAAVYPGLQGGPLMHVIAAKAAAFREAAEPAFADYQRRVLENASVLAQVLAERGHAVVSGGTKNHMLLLDLGPTGVDGGAAEAALERAHIAVNSLSLPRARNGRESAEGGAGFAAEGGTGSPPPGASRGRLDALRLGTAAVTTRGFGAQEIARVGHWIGDVLEDVASVRVVERVRGEALALCRRLPVYG